MGSDSAQPGECGWRSAGASSSEGPCVKRWKTLTATEMASRRTTPFGFTDQGQIVDAPAKCHDLRLELYSDTSDARHLLARVRFYQLPRRYSILELENGTAYRPHSGRSAVPCAG